jgi:hypothetical protein
VVAKGMGVERERGLEVEARLEAAKFMILHVTPIRIAS